MQSSKHVELSTALKATRHLTPSALISPPLTDLLLLRPRVPPCVRPVCGVAGCLLCFDSLDERASHVAAVHHIGAAWLRPPRLSSSFHALLHDTLLTAPALLDAEPRIVPPVRSALFVEPSPAPAARRSPFARLDATQRASLPSERVLELRRRSAHAPKSRDDELGLRRQALAQRVADYHLRAAAFAAWREQQAEAAAKREAEAAAQRHAVAEAAAAAAALKQALRRRAEAAPVPANIATAALAATEKVASSAKRKRADEQPVLDLCDDDDEDGGVEILPVAKKAVASDAEPVQTGHAPLCVLEPINAGAHRELRLGAGSHTLGRGDATGVKEKELSRSQLRLAVDATQRLVTLERLGINACHLQRADGERMTLEQNRLYTLHSGDSFSLLFKRHWYLIKVTDVPVEAAVVDPDPAAPVAPVEVAVPTEIAPVALAEVATTESSAAPTEFVCVLEPTAGSLQRVQVGNGVHRFEWHGAQLELRVDAEKRRAFATRRAGAGTLIRAAGSLEMLLDSPYMLVSGNQVVLDAGTFAICLPAM
jgi:hypothetical protein